MIFFKQVRCRDTVARINEVEVKFLPQKATNILKVNNTKGTKRTNYGIKISYDGFHLRSSNNS
jgi:hypothetical protein